MKKIFEKGGPHKIKKTGADEFSLTISIPADADGRMARECSNAECSPGYFKVMPGTGITEGHELAYCPYCRREGVPNDFTTKEQIRFAKDTVTREAHRGIDAMFREALGVGSSGKKKMGGGLVSLGLSYKSAALPHVRRPFEDEIRRDVVCPVCTLDQTVFGLATWCSDCGNDIFMTHVSSELGVTRLMVGDITRRQELLGSRVAGKDLENCLEDAVSIFEASIKALVRRALVERDEGRDSVEARFKKIGNSFQNIERTKERLIELFSFDIGNSEIFPKLSAAFEKRHPVTHNLGVVDRKYMEKTQQSEKEGREVRISVHEVESLLSMVEDAVGHIYAGIVQKS